MTTTTVTTAPPLAEPEPDHRVRRRRSLSPGKRVPAARLVGPALLIVLWAAASAAGALDPGAIPAPWTVVETGVHLWTDGTLPDDILTSLQRAGTGFVIGLTAGIALALASGLTRTGEALIDGTVNLNRAIPTLGLIPLFILWLASARPSRSRSSPSSSTSRSTSTPTPRCPASTAASSNSPRCRG